MSLLFLLLGLTPPPAPTPTSSREVPACSLELELPPGGVAVGKVCLLGMGETRCAGDDVIAVPDRPPHGTKVVHGSRGVILGPIRLVVREERYEGEIRYLLVRAPGDPRSVPYVVAAAPVSTDVESRACPQGPRFLEPRESVALFAAGSAEVGLGRPLSSVSWPASGGPWLVVTLERVR